MRIEIGGQRADPRVRIGKADVAVGSNEVDGIAQEPGLMVIVLSPRENVQRQRASLAHRQHLGRGFAIHVNLPLE